jgi:hypothetical protein
MTSGYLPASGYFRVILYVDKMSKAGQPNINMVLDQEDNVQSVYNNVNVDQRRRFTVLVDKTMKLENRQAIAFNPTVNTPVVTDPPLTFWEIKKKLNFTSNVNRANQGLYSDFDTGQLVLGIVQDNINTFTLTHHFNINLEYEGVEEHEKM